jgi:hypothetical protein
LAGLKFFFVLQHSKNQGSYGITAIFDRLFGTDAAYNEFIKAAKKE